MALPPHKLGQGSAFSNTTLTLRKRIISVALHRKHEKRMRYVENGENSDFGNR